MNQSVLYLECNSGISGDMTVAALLDLGADRQVLSDALKSLPLSGYSIEIKDVYKSGLRACDFNVILEHDNHDHDMEYLHGHSHDHAAAAAEHFQLEHIHAAESLHDHIQDTPHDHPHDAPHDHPHDVPHDHPHDAPHDHPHDVPHDHALHDVAENPGHTHNHDAHHHSHTSRNLQDITEIINAGALTDRARRLALRIFRILAEAEASVHGKSVNEIHFHEVGAVDSIVDIVAVAVCLDNLNPARVVVSPLTDGTGQIRCQHGLIPVPVPAVTAIAAQNGLLLKLTDIEGELVTPTGAAIAAALQATPLLSDVPRPGHPSASPSDMPRSNHPSALPSDAPRPNRPSASLSDMPKPDLPNVSRSPATDSDIPKPGVPAQGYFASELPSAFRIQKIGLGAGKRDYATTGILRAMLLELQDRTERNELPYLNCTGGNDLPRPNCTREDELPHPNSTDGPRNTSPVPQGNCDLPGITPSALQSHCDDSDRAPSAPQYAPDASADTILSLETNIDDCTGEALAFTMQELLDHGALDVFYVPIYMKKNRPAWLLRVLCHADRRAVLESVIFKNTTTIGIRIQEMQRTKLPRQIVSLNTPWGRAEVKCCTHNGETYYYPENDSICELSRKNQIGFPDMYHLVQEYAKTHGKTN